MCQAHRDQRTKPGASKWMVDCRCGGAGSLPGSGSRSAVDSSPVIRAGTAKCHRCCSRGERVSSRCGGAVPFTAQRGSSQPVGGRISFQGMSS